MKKWLKDDNGNRASVNYFGSQELAQKALDSLINCSGCVNCSCCRGCSDCRDCRGCSDCRGCRGCSSCNGCRDCSDCSYCIGCRDCSDCNGCRGCSYSVNQNKQSNNNSSYKIPVLGNIHSKIYKAVSAAGALDMGSWHTCSTTHCRAGWVVTLAGEEGKALEDFHNTCLAAQLIYRESSPLKVSVNRFFDSDKEGLADMKRMAELEENQI